MKENDIKTVIGNTDSELWGVSIERLCQVLNQYFYNGETWYTLKDVNTGEILDSPSVFWNKYN